MPDERYTVHVCHGTGCVSGGAEEVYARLGTIAGSGIRLKRTGCHGFCQQGPVVVIEPDGIFYCRVRVSDVGDIVASLSTEGRPVERLLYRDPAAGRTITKYGEIPFYRRQERILLRNCGRIDPEDIDDYLATGGYQALSRALEMSPEEIIAEIRHSGLRGLGGAGFPAGRKWEACRRAPGTEKFVICNGDEGDPGAFQDRSVMEGDPHAVLEGMAIAGYAVGAARGYIYVRAEYPLAVKRLQLATEQARQRGFLGRHILDRDFSFDIEVFQGAGAFVCGESTALVSSMEGNRGFPKPLPRPRTTESGLWGKPTLLNNVKTFAYVPKIILHGAGWFASRGTDKSKGTAVFSLTGKVANCGLIEVPMGTTLRQIIFEIGGGIPDGKRFKAVQTGGPSGGCLPADLLDLPVDFDSLTAAGSMMGSGGMVVVDEDTCMVDLARYFLDFSQRESCGQCLPCRLGTRQMFAILDDITRGRGRPEDLARLEELGRLVARSSLCGLGQTAPNPVLTTLRYFREEYEAHIKGRRCPAGVCGL
jgi:NADH:ubiquinone oxidoreductase subunit F (NADH-binding)/(2Fe-2S) ferredoxin